MLAENSAEDLPDPKDLVEAAEAAWFAKWAEILVEHMLEKRARSIGVYDAADVLVKAAGDLPAADRGRCGFLGNKGAIRSQTSFRDYLKGDRGSTKNCKVDTHDGMYTLVRKAVPLKTKNAAASCSLVLVHNTGME